MIYRLFFFIAWLLLASFATECYGQLSDDSLKKLVGIRDCQATSNRSVAEIIEKKIYGNAYEVFEGFFPGIKIYDFYGGKYRGRNIFVTCDDCTKLLYAVDIYTGLPVDIKEVASFNRQMQKSKLHFTYADKAYIYLLLNGLLSDGLPAAPDQYRMTLFRHSQFPINGLSLWRFDKFRRGTDGIKYDEYNQHYIDISSHTTFYIPVLKYQNSGRVVTIHEFNFGVSGELIEHSSFLLQEWR